MTTLKLQQNSNYEKKKKTQTQNVKKLKLWQNSRSQIVKKNSKIQTLTKLEIWQILILEEEKNFWRVF